MTAVAALAAAQAGAAQSQLGGAPATGDVMGVAAAEVPTKPAPAPPKRSAHILWAPLIARIYEVFSLLCPFCGCQVRISGFVVSADIRHILDHIGVQSEAPPIAAARGPPLWEDCGAQACEGTQLGPHWLASWTEAAQLAPNYEVDQRINW